MAMALGRAPLNEANESPTPTQEGHLLAIETPLGKDVMLLTALDGTETVSRGFVYTIEMLTLSPDAEVRTLLGKPVTMWLRNDLEAQRRPLHGHVRHLTRLTVDLRGYRRWRAEVAPWLWFLTRTVDCRIYQNLTIPEILRSIFDEHGLSHYEIRLHAEYPKLAFCVQYRESIFDFVSRLMEHVGIFYWFEHHQDRHVLVLADSNDTARFTQPQQVVLSVRPDLGEIQELQHDHTFRSGNWALNDFDFEVPTKNLCTREPTRLEVEPMKRFEIFDYPGSYTAREEGTRLTRLRIEGEEARHLQASGAGSCVGFDPGKRFTLMPDEMAGEEKPATYLLTEVRHSAREPGYFSTTSDAASYGNRFVAIPAETPFRPERLTPKPIVQGPQTATVVGPAGENIHTDQYGRVRVLFHWDRRGKRDEHASCWIRVSQHAAGSHWGSLAIPHVGQEVIVSFLEGDPDRPIVTGHVHNGNNMPPLDLPRDKDKTILRDHGDNKLIMHGKAGAQWLSAVSPRAVNLVAMRSAAKPLSSDVVIGGVDFDGSQDTDGYNDLYSLWQELEGKTPQTTSAPPLPDAKGKSFSVDTSGVDAAYQADVNLLGEGRINTLSGGNTNTWAGGNSNTWVHGDANAWVGGNSNTRVGGDMNQEVIGSTETISHGSVQNTYKHSVRDTIDIAHEEETSIHNEFTGIHSEFTIAHFENTIGIHTEFHVGMHLDFNEGLKIKNWVLDSEQSITAIKSWGTWIANAAIKIANTDLDLDQATLKLILGG
jgi:type VI secretion system secreted protein VgrG